MNVILQEDNEALIPEQVKGLRVLWFFTLLGSVLCSHS